uniref:Uncharacterized protein n=1 Tax=Pararge aegeria TaxID=116150 RepID=S4PAF1_9NEOP
MLVPIYVISYIFVCNKRYTVLRFVCLLDSRYTVPNSCRRLLAIAPQELFAMQSLFVTVCAYLYRTFCTM